MSQVDLTNGRMTQMNQIIEKIAESSESITHMANDQNKQAAQIQAQLGESDQAIGNLTRLIDEMNEAAKEIAKNSAELATSSNEINKNMSEIDIANRQTEKSAGQVKGEASGLAQITNDLKEMVGTFTLADKGS